MDDTVQLIRMPKGKGEIPLPKVARTMGRMWQGWLIDLNADHQEDSARYNPRDGSFVYDSDKKVATLKIKGLGSIQVYQTGAVIGEVQDEYSTPANMPQIDKAADYVARRVARIVRRDGNESFEFSEDKTLRVPEGSSPLYEQWARENGVKVREKSSIIVR